MNHKHHLSHDDLTAAQSDDFLGKSGSEFDFDPEEVGVKISRRQKMFALLPTLLTLGNAACGFASISSSARLGPEFASENYLLYAGLLILLAMVFDMFDGSAARWTKQTSEFGAQLDSLCDGISFGVAPAFLLLKFCEGYYPRMLWVISCLFVLCAVLRLARFNVETEEDDSHLWFSGLPSPAAAGAIASFPIGMHGLRSLAEAGGPLPLAGLPDQLIVGTQYALPLMALAMALLMVSRVRYSHLFNQLMRGQGNRSQLIVIILCIAVVFLLRELALPLVFCFFVFLSPARAFWEQTLGKRLYRERSI